MFFSRKKQTQINYALVVGTFCDNMSLASGKKSKPTTKTSFKNNKLRNYSKITSSFQRSYKKNKDR